MHNTMEHRVNQRIGEGINKQTIEHLGGANKLVVMLGSKLPVLVDNEKRTVRVFVGAKNRIGCTMFEVGYDEGRDDYRLTFWKVRKLEATRLQEATGLHADGLRSLIERVLGLYLSL